MALHAYGFLESDKIRLPAGRERPSRKAAADYASLAKRPGPRWIALAASKPSEEVRESFETPWPSRPTRESSDSKDSSSGTI